MRRCLPLLLLALSSTAHAAPPEDHPGRILLLYVLYGVLSGCLLGWSYLALLMARPKVELAAHTLGQRPLASFVMGMLCFGWLLLSLSLPQAIGPLGGLFVVVTLCVLMTCALIGLPAILMGLGRRASLALALDSSPVREIALGAAVLFAAGGLPFLGWLLLAGVVVWACGGAVLSLLAGNGQPAKDTEGDTL